jgi:hypothetical protein
MSDQPTVPDTLRSIAEGVEAAAEQSGIELLGVLTIVWVEGGGLMVNGSCEAVENAERLLVSALDVVRVSIIQPPSTVQ